MGAREATQGAVEGGAERTSAEIVNRVRARVCSVRSTNTLTGTIQSTPGSHSATRAGTASLAGKGNENFARVVVAPEARKAARQDAAGQELPELALDKARQPLAAAA